MTSCWSGSSQLRVHDEAAVHEQGRARSRSWRRRRAGRRSWPRVPRARRPGAGRRARCSTSSRPGRPSAARLMWRLDPAGLDRVHPDAVRTQVAAERLGQHADGALGAAVGGLARARPRARRSSSRSRSRRRAPPGSSAWRLRCRPSRCRGRSSRTALLKSSTVVSSHFMNGLIAALDTTQSSRPPRRPRRAPWRVTCPGSRMSATTREALAAGLADPPQRLGRVLLRAGGSRPPPRPRRPAAPRSPARCRSSRR